MGEIAEDAIEGRKCSTCGVYFAQDHGHPVVCDHCWKRLTPNERAGVQRAYFKEL